MAGRKPRTAGDKLRAARTRAGLTVDKLAEVAGVTGRSIYRIESGETQWVRMETATKLAAVLDLDAADLYTRKAA